MYLILDDKILRRTTILFLIAILLILAVSDRCPARNEQISRYLVTISLINPSKIYVGGEELQIVILKKDDKRIICYEYGDPDKSILLFKRDAFKLKKVRDDVLEGYLLSDSNDFINIIATSDVKDNLLHRHNIQEGSHHLGKTFAIPISEIRELTVLKKGRAGKGMAIGAGVGLGAAALATQAYDPDKSSGMVTFDKGEAFVLYAVLFVVPSTLVGGTIGASKKRVKSVIINGNEEEYHRIKPELERYFINVGSEIDLNNDDLSPLINTPM